MKLHEWANSEPGASFLRGARLGYFLGLAAAYFILWQNTPH
jgi:hypothetical protein